MKILQSAFLPLVKKEIQSGLNTVSFYLAAVFFLLFSSVWFLNIYDFAARDYASFREYFSIFPLLFVVLIPMLTMRSWAEEIKSGTSEILLTMPFTGWQLVFGKFFALFVVFKTIILLTIPLIFILQFLGDFSLGPIFTQYLGVFFLGASSIALGQFVSSLFKNQITAALITITVLLFFTLVFQTLTANLSGGLLAAVLSYLSLSHHFESFARGVLDSRDIFFFLIFTGFFLYLNIMVIIFRKWR